MRRLLPAVAVGIALTGPGAAAADFYLGAGVGSTNAELSSSTTLNFDATGYQGSFGFQPMRYFAVELGYTDFGDLDETSGTQRFQGDASALALWGVGILPVTPRVALYGRLGYAAYESEVNATIGGSAPTRTTTDGADIAWGFGVSYSFTGSWGIRLEWENYRFEASDTVTFTSLDVMFKF